MNIDIYAFSRCGAALCTTLIDGLSEHDIQALVPEKFADESRFVKSREADLNKSVERSFAEKDAIIFIGAAGIAIRAIAPFVKSKKTDPAVLCMDEKGLNVISLLSGHIGGANQLTLKIAAIVGGNPVITTATDINGKFAVDEWSNNLKMHIASMKTARDIASEILEGNKIGLVSDFDIEGDIPDEIDLNRHETGICISLDIGKKPFYNTLNLIPRIVSVGVGCRRGAEFNIIYNAIKDALQEYNISHHAVKSLNSIELKEHEEGLIKSAEALNVPFNIFTRDELNNIEGEFSDSAFVKSIAGVDTVCERAAMAGSVSKKLFIKKTVKNSVTVAACIDDYTVSFEYKQKYRREHE